MKENNFNIIPAIDILDGKCVRLTQGEYDKVEEFSSNPSEIAKKWFDSGAKRLHVIDLNGAKEGLPVNFKVISNIAKSTEAKVQVGGGIRNHETIKKYLSEGVSYLIFGTKIFKDRTFLEEIKELYDEKVIIGLDLKNNKVVLSGWEETVDISISSLNDYIGQIKQVIYTDVSKDGTLSGPNLTSVSEIAGLLKSNIIVSGGVSRIEDIIEILNLKKKKHANITGIILGKSLYRGTINLKSSIEIAEKELGKQ